MTKGSLRKAHQWPYPRHRRFEETLREAASSWFEAKGFPVDDRYPFILADWADWPRNLLLPEVAFYIQKESAQAAAAGRPFPLHKYLHHGLSSQAMLFNLIGPLIVRNDL
ncbi:MAG: hypothetical protein IT330_04340, partial [Anaerolineae bacterium]|nr:hypothetical protein [Anaerolineae bacterium]